MSIVKVQGNASGTGTLTIAAPNTNSDRTLTLPDSSGTLVLDGASQSPTFGTVTATALSVNGNNISAANSMGFRNRIINGDMRIDQRNAGASVATSAGSVVYTVDRWAANYTQTSKYTVQQNAGSVTPPSGFTNYLGATSSAATSLGASDFFMLNQRIEGFNVADLGWGAAGAQAVTLSFWVRSSLTGTFGGVLTNSAQNRSYPFTYAISAANTWEQKTVTIAGDTSGTWLKDNGIGIFVNFGLGVGSTYSGTAGAWAGSNLYSATGATSVVGTNGATFYITGVQLEAGSVASPFERRDYGRELDLCQRYYVGPYEYWFTSGYDPNYTTINRGGVAWSYQMRATPSIVITGGSMSGHHATAPVASGVSRNGADLQFQGSAFRSGVNTAASVSFTLNAEL